MYSSERPSTSSSSTHRTDPILHNIRRIPPLEATYHPLRNALRYRAESPTIPSCPSTCSPWRPCGLAVVLCISLSLGASIAYAGAQAYEQLDNYISDIRDRQRFDAYD